VAEPRQIEESARFGQVGETWGNLLTGTHDWAVDDLLTFDGKEVFKVKRVLQYPLDGTKALVYYESTTRLPVPGSPRAGGSADAA